MDYVDLLWKLLRSEVRKHFFERHGPAVVLTPELKRYDVYKSRLETHPRRLPRPKELEVILAIIDELAIQNSPLLCPSCIHNQDDELSLAYGKEWVAKNYPGLAGSIAREKDIVEVFNKLPNEIYLRLERALSVYTPIICQKVRIKRLDNELLYICPHFEKDKYYDAAVHAQVLTEEHDREALTEMRKKYQAELEKLSGTPPSRRM